MRLHKIFTEGTRIMVTYPTGIKREHPSVSHLVKKFFRGNRQINKDVSNQLKDRDSTTYQGYFIEKIKSNL